MKCTDDWLWDDDPTAIVDDSDTTKHSASCIQLARQMTVRRPALDDAAAVTGLINLSALLDTNALPMTVDRLRCSWQAESLDLNHDAWLLYDDNKLVGYGELWAVAPDAAYLWLHVHPDHGVADVDETILRLARVHLQQSAMGTFALRTVVAGYSYDSRRRLHQLGFTLVDRFWERCDGVNEPEGLQARLACRTFQPDVDGIAVCRYDVYELAQPVTSD